MDSFLCTGATGLPGVMGPKGHQGINFIFPHTKNEIKEAELFEFANRLNL